MRDRFDARHEAGHAVAAAVLNQPLRYVTLRPQGGNAGHVMYRRDQQWLPWRETGIVLLAGIAAEQMLNPDRDDLVDGGRDDLNNTRHIARRAIAWRAKHPAQTDIDPGWSEWDIGALFWRRAVDMVTEHIDAIDWLTDLLLASPRAVTARQIREVLAGSDRNDERPDRGADEWWIPRHTRMQWRRTA